MKKRDAKQVIKELIIIFFIISVGIGFLALGARYNIQISSDSKLNINNIQTENVQTVLTMEDIIEDDSIWCGTFQLTWNDLKNNLAKQDIIFERQTTQIDNLNKGTFTEKDLSKKYYYKKVGNQTFDVKKEIEKDIKKKFNESSSILNNIDWKEKNVENYILYAMLKKEFPFKEKFDESQNMNFKGINKYTFFGFSSKEQEKVKNQVSILYYNSDDDFAIKLKTKKEDEIILCKHPEGNSFREVYNNIKEKEKNYKGSKNIEEEDIMWIPNLYINKIDEFKEIEHQDFCFSNGIEYYIDNAMQTVQFKLDKTGGKIKVENRTMALAKEVIIIDYKRLIFDDTFAMFLIEREKENPYFAVKIDDLSKFQ